MNTKKQTLSPAEKDELKKRVLAISPKIGKDYIGDICRIYPKYNTHEGRRLLLDVRTNRKVDNRITEILEEYVAQREAMFSKLQKA